MNLFSCSQKYDHKYENHNGLAVVSKNGKYGYINKDGEKVTPIKYDNAFRFDGTMAVVVLDGKYGAININGQEEVPLKYDKLFAFKDGISIARIKNKYAYINSKGIETTPFIYDKAYEYEPEAGLACAIKNGKYGYVDKNGVEKIPFEFDYACHFHNNISIAGKDGKNGYINNKGDIIIPIKYDWALCFNQHFAQVGMIGKSGLVNEQGEEVYPIIFDRILNQKDDNEHIITFSHDIGTGVLDGKYVFFDKKGNYLFNRQFDYATMFSEKGKAFVSINNQYFSINTKGDLSDPIAFEKVLSIGALNFAGKRDNKWALLNLEGEEITDFLYDDVVTSSYHGYIQVYIKDKTGLIDSEGHIIIEPEYDNLYSYGDHLFVVSKNNKYGITDLKNNWILPIEYNSISKYHDVYVLYNQEKYGMLDEKGNRIMDDIYDMIRVTGSNSIIVGKDGKMGMITPQKDTILPFIYDEIREQNPNYLIVSLNSKYGIVRSDGSMLLEPIYDFLSMQYNSDMAIAQKDDQHYFIDMEGNRLNEASYDEIKFLSDAFYSVKKNGKWGVINKELEEILPPIYTNIRHNHNGFFEVSQDNFQFGLFGLTDFNGKVLTEMIYSNFGYFRYFDSSGEVYLGRDHVLEANSIKPDSIVGFASLNNKQGKYGIIDMYGNLKTDLIFSKIDVISRDYFIGYKYNDITYDQISNIYKIDNPAEAVITANSIVRNGKYFNIINGGKHGIIDSNLKTLIPIEYDYLQNVMESYYIASKDSKYGLLSADNNIVFDFKYQNILYDYTSNLFICLDVYNNTGCINIEGHIVIPFEYTSISSFNGDNIAIVSRNNKWGAINDKNEVICDIVYDEMENNAHSKFIIAKNDKEYFVFNNKFETVVDSSFEYLQKLAGESFLIAKKAGKFGTVDYSGKEIIPFKYDSISNESFYGLPFLTIIKDDLKGVCFIDGKIICKPNYESITAVQNYYFVVKKNGKYGLFDLYGNLIAPEEYDHIETYFSQEYIRATKNNDTFLIDKLGNIQKKE